jgi:hypothetical protein
MNTFKKFIYGKNSTYLLKFLFSEIKIYNLIEKIKMNKIYN